MYAVFYTIGMVLLWIVNLFNGTGIGKTYKIIEIAMVCAVVVATICLASQALTEGELLVKPHYFYTIVPLVIMILGNLFIKGYSLLNIRGFWGFLLVFILSKTRPNVTAIRMTSICYGILGLIILFIYDYMDVLKGWNGNTIAMIGLFSFLVFTIPFFGMREWRSFVSLPLIGAAYVILIIPTASRSCILMIAIQLLLVLRIVPIRKFLETSKGLIILLQIPLIVAIFVVLAAMLGDMSGLTKWSYETFNKPLFNGRDELWLYGLKIWKNHALFGDAYFQDAQWHNVGITCLVSIGAVGYFFWIRLLYLLLKEGQKYLEDTCIIGAMVAFITLYCQQSVELGFFAISPNIVPYIILGIILGRIRCLKGRYPQ